jgi:type VI secretion system protein ImpL
MAIFDRIKAALESTAGKIAAIIIAVAILLALAVKFHLFALLTHSRWFPEILAGIVIIIVFAIVFWGIPWFREWRFMRAYGSAARADGGESPQEFRAKFVNAISRLRQLPQLEHSSDPIHALPWYLTLGAGGSGKTTALASAGLFTPHTQPPSEGGTANCDWWVSSAMVVLDTPGRFAIPLEPARDRVEWYRLLRLIKHYRIRESLNGIIVTVAADQLASDSAEKLRTDGGVIRERIEEAIRELGVSFPVYLLVTKCDLVEGFSEFFGAMPQRVLGEALGYVEEQFRIGGANPASNEPMQRLQTGLRSTSERLHAIRLALLNSNVPEALRGALFCFLEEVRALEQPLRAFAAPLVSEDVVYHSPLFRGVFFASAKCEGIPISLLRRQLGVAAAPPPPESRSRQPYFLRDLFTTIVPRDRGLRSELRFDRKVK